MIMIDRNELHAMKTAARFDEFGNTRFPTMAKRAVEFGLEPADSIKSESMSCFARTNLGPTYTSHETFLRSPFCEDIHKVSEYDVAVVGIPYDSGASNRSGTRLGPAGIRHASSQISPFNPDYGVDLYENIKLCDAGDIYTLPANAEKTFDQMNAKFTLRASNLITNDFDGALSVMETNTADAFMMDDVLLKLMQAASKNKTKYVITKGDLAIQPLSLMMRKDDPEFKKNAKELHLPLDYMGPEEFAKELKRQDAFLREEFAKSPW